MAYAADQTKPSQQSNARNGPIVRVIWHHQAGANDDGTIGAMVSGSRQVSATWTVDNKAPVGGGLRDYARITAVVPEDRRPWTSASRADDGALTVECANSSGPPDYGISDESHEACARLAAYAYKTYGVPLRRATPDDTSGHLGHNEVLGMFGDGYSTACPLHLDIDRIIARAAELVGDGISSSALNSAPVEEDMMSALSTEQQQTLYNNITVIRQMLLDNSPPATLLPLVLQQESYNRGIVIQSLVSQLLERKPGGVDADSLAASIADALDDTLASKVADLLSKRLAA